MKIYYDTEMLKNWLKMLNPIKTWKLFTYWEESIVCYVFFGFVTICAIFLALFLLPIIFLIPIKINRY